MASSSSSHRHNLLNTIYRAIPKLLTFGKDIKTVYVDDLLVIDPMMGAIEVDWRNFFPYLQWIPNTSFENKIEQMHIRREAVMKSLIQQHKKRIESENLDSFIKYLLSEAQPLTEKQLVMSLWEPIIETPRTMDMGYKRYWSHFISC